MRYLPEKIGDRFNMKQTLKELNTLKLCLKLSRGVNAPFNEWFMEVCNHSAVWFKMHLSVGEVELWKDECNITGIL